MSTAATIPAIKRTITVAAPAERAFRVFTDSFTSWWPADYHIGQADFANAVIEPKEGGRWYEPAQMTANATGAECSSGSHRTGWC